MHVQCMYIYLIIKYFKMAVSGKNEADDLPGKVVAELTGHQGPVRAVRFNGTQVDAVMHARSLTDSACRCLLEMTGVCPTICSSHVQWSLSILLQKGHSELGAPIYQMRTLSAVPTT